MNVAGVKYKNGHPVDRGRLDGVEMFHEIPSQWIKAGRRPAAPPDPGDIIEPAPPPLTPAPNAIQTAHTQPPETAEPPKPARRRGRPKKQQTQ